MANANNDSGKKQENSEDLLNLLEQEKEAKLMALADLENFRKKVTEEKAQLRIEANLSVFRALAELIDDFERLISDLDDKSKEEEIDAFKPILDKAIGIMADYGIKQIEINPGDKFSHEQMEAIGTTKAESEKQDNTVTNIAQKGYIDTNSGRIIRHARVIVAKK